MGGCVCPPSVLLQYFEVPLEVPVHTGTRGAGGLRFCNVARAVIRSAWTSPKYRGRKFCVLCARSVTIAAKNRTLMRRNCAQFRSCVSKLTQLQKQFTQFENAASRKRSFECTSSSNNKFLKVESGVERLPPIQLSALAHKAAFQKDDEHLNPRERTHLQVLDCLLRHDHR